MTLEVLASPSEFLWETLAAPSAMFTTHKPTKRSPIRQSPLPLPGQSLQREADRLLYDKVLPTIAIPIMALGIAVYEWWRWLHPLPGPPIGFTALAVVLSGHAAYKVPGLIKTVRALNLGLDGEKSVGQELEQLRERGCRVLHDLPGEGFNLDHVVIAPSGIYVIETKTHRKPCGRDATVTFDGEQIRVDGYVPDRDYIRQALAARTWLNNLVFEVTGKRFPVRAAIVFPGWYVTVTGKSRQPGLWVLNPKALPAFISREAAVLQSHDITVVEAGLSRFIRSRQNEP